MKRRLHWLLLASTVALAGCFNPISQPIQPDGRDSGSRDGALQVSMIIPDYQAMGESGDNRGSRVIDPGTASVAILLNNVEIDVLALTEGTTTVVNSLNNSWSGTFTGIPAGSHAAGAFKVELRGSDNSPLTSGLNTSTISINPGKTTTGISIYTLPVSSTTLTADAAPVTGNVGAQKMVYYSMGSFSGGQFVVTLTPTDGGNPDLYFFSTNGQITEKITGAGTHTRTYTATETGTTYLGIYGTTASTFTIELDLTLTLTAPTGVTASDGTSSSSVGITWSAVTSAGGYNIYRSTTETGTYTQLNTGLITSTYYYDSTAAVATTYYYKVEAVAGAYKSPQSTPDTGYMGLGSTTAYATQGVFSDHVEIQWFSVTGAAAYEVYRKPSAGTYTKIADGITSPTYTDDEIVAGTTYVYYVLAINGISQSVSFNTASGYASATPSWQIGTLIAGSPTWYSFDAVAGTSYEVYWLENGSYSFTGSITVTAYRQDTTAGTYFSDSSSTGYISSAAATEKIYLRVTGQTSASTGTFALKVCKYNASTSQYEDFTLTKSVGSIDFIIQ